LKIRKKYGAPHVVAGRVLDIGKIQSVIGYQPSVELEEISERVIASFRDSEDREFASSQKSA
jgi:nucleoside-diphosphate-sugar epimerase